MGRPMSPRVRVRWGSGCRSTKAFHCDYLARYLSVAKFYGLLISGQAPTRTPSPPRRVFERLSAQERLLTLAPECQSRPNWGNLATLKLRDICCWPQPSSMSSSTTSAETSAARTGSRISSPPLSSPTNAPKKSLQTVHVKCRICEGCGHRSEGQRVVQLSVGARLGRTCVFDQQRRRGRVLLSFCE